MDARGPPLGGGRLEGVCHALCNAPLLWALQAVVDHDPHDPEPWAAPRRRPVPPGRGRGSGSAAVPGWTRPWPTMRRCLTDPAVPFTNNRAEQDLRVLTVRQKVSGGFRTRQGAEDDALWRSVVTTARKQGWDLRPAWTRSAAQFRADLTSGMQARDAPA